MAERTYGVAVVGAGRMGRRHMTAIARVPWFDLRVVCDANLEVAEAQAQAFGADAWLSDYQDAVKRDVVDVVYVCVPAGLHAAVAVAGAENGKHVYCEKPFCLTLDDGERMIRTAEQAGVKLAIGFQHRFQRIFARLKEMLTDGSIERPTQYVIVGAGSIRPLPAMHDMAGNAGPFVDSLCHYLDMWRYVFGSDPVRVFARVDTFAKGKDALASVQELAPDTGVVVVEFASGDTGLYYDSSGLPEGSPGFSATHVVAPNALIEVEGFFAKLRVSLNGGPAEETPDMTISIQDLQNAAAEHFAKAVRDGTPVRTGGKDGLIALKVSLAAFESAKTGEAVSLR